MSYGVVLNFKCRANRSLLFHSVQLLYQPISEDHGPIYILEMDRSEDESKLELNRTVKQNKVGWA